MHEVNNIFTSLEHKRKLNKPTMKILKHFISVNLIKYQRFLLLYDLNFSSN